MWMLLQPPALAEAIGIKEVLSRLKDQSQPLIVVETYCLLVPLWHRGDLPSDLDFMPLLMAAISVCYLCLLALFVFILSSLVFGWNRSLFSFSVCIVLYYVYGLD
uniref:Uncharacterized protein n=1 Tax=Cannabis sativa TaxID=3483 RepID=A0A803R2Q8_CANSA